MNLATVILRLPVGIARGVTDFLFVPSRGAHPHRIAAWVPSVIDESQPAAAKPLADLLGQAETVLEFDQPLHQVALLPQPWLADLARRIAIDALDWALRQVVWRQDLEQLDPYVTEADWQRIYTPPTQGGEPIRRLHRAADLVQDLQCTGWNYLERASETLPRPIARRLLLKCEPVSAPTWLSSSVDDRAIAAQVSRSYGAWVGSAVPGWSQSLAEVPSRIRGSMS